MRYVVSDLHGEYDMFIRLLEKIKFSPSDEMYICGDIIDKGPMSIKLAKLVFSQPNMYPIMGNHEEAFLMYYHSLMNESADDYEGVLKKLQDYFPDEKEKLDWDTVDRMENLPHYIEKEDFICVHAGIPIDNNGKLMPLSAVPEKILLHDRHFKNMNAVHKSPKCVFFGHTQTNTVCGEGKILPYLRYQKPAPYTVSDFYKVHLDTGTWSLGVMGCFAIDSPRIYYVKK